MNTVDIFRSFANILRKRMEDASRKDEPLSEDTVCFYIAAAYVQAGRDAQTIEMEVPHPALRKPKGMQKAVDILVCRGEGLVWIEVKFDREPPSGASMNETNRFGKLINDMLRAAIIPQGERLVIYLTTATMDSYLRNNQPHFQQSQPFVIDRAFLDRLPPSASSQVGGGIIERIPPGGVSATLLAVEGIDSLKCFLYGITSNQLVTAV